MLTREYFEGLDQKYDSDNPKSETEEDSATETNPQDQQFRAGNSENVRLTSRDTDECSEPYLDETDEEDLTVRSAGTQQRANSMDLEDLGQSVAYIDTQDEESDTTSTEDNYERPESESPRKKGTQKRSQSRKQLPKPVDDPPAKKAKRQVNSKIKDSISVNSNPRYNLGQCFLKLVVCIVQFLVTHKKDPYFETMIKKTKTCAKTQIAVRALLKIMTKRADLEDIKDFELAIRGSIFPEPRGDECQKKVLSKLTWLIYYRYKKARITKVKAHARMKQEFDLEGDDCKEGSKLTNAEIFDRIFGSDRKQGLHNDVVKEILVNEKLFNTLLNPKTLKGLRYKLDKQTNEDIETNIISKFETFSIDELISMEKASTTGSSRQRIKMPWSRIENVQAILQFLRKLQHRAEKENLDSQLEHLNGLLEIYQMKYYQFKETYAIQ